MTAKSIHIQRTYPYKTWLFGRLAVTVGRQGGGAPIVDGCKVWSVDGWEATGWAIRIPRSPGRALIVARKDWKGTGQIAAIRRLNRIPLLRLLFKARF